MDEPGSVKKQNYKLEKTASIALIIIVLIAVSYLIFYFTWESQLKENKYTSFYTNVTADYAFNLINNSINLTIVDCRGLEGCGTCSFKNDGHLKQAELNSNAETLHNWSADILVYSKDGNVGASFCQDLIGKVYGKIYNLDGGIDAWNELKYPLVYGSE